jgi:hypothetical protein
MATNDFLSDNVVFQTRASGSTAPWQTWVCNTTLSANLASTVNELITKCGTIQTPSNVTGTINFSGAANTAPDSTQVSLKNATDYASAKTLLDGRLINLVDGSVGLGDAILIRGTGRISSVTVNADSGSPLTFDAVFSISGTPDTEESDES